MDFIQIELKDIYGLVIHNAAANLLQMILIKAFDFTPVELKIIMIIFAVV